ncbi:hypothetical protein ACIP9C_22555 [Lysinibacillus sp. NPDC093210]|uniref:hypothetical protein n=1 Tax=Lysinibacillus sp. NPDC093210 TaxID=3364133 RepID=UPI0038038407
MSRTRDLKDAISEAENWINEIESKLEEIIKLADGAESIEVKDDLYDLINEIQNEAEAALYVLR